VISLQVYEFFYKIIEFVIINIVLELCQNHVKDKKMSFKLNTLLTHVSYEYIYVSVSNICL